MFDLYPRHSHRTPDQIAEDTGGSFEPARLRRRASDFDDDYRPRPESTPRPAESTAKRKSDNPATKR